MLSLPFPGLRPTPSTLAQSKERKGSNFAIWQPWDKDHLDGNMFTGEMQSRMRITLRFWVLLKTTFGPDNPKGDGNEAVYQVDLRSYDLPHPDSGRKNDLNGSFH